MKIKVAWIGKTKEPAIQALTDDYLKRISRYADATGLALKDEAAVLALARAAGETAPLLLTALGNLFFSTDLLRPIAALPLQIYQYAASPYEDWHAKAWGASFILVAVIAAVSFALRAFAPRGAR